jgi:hypothetical protein
MNSFFLYGKLKGFGEVKDNFSDVKMCENHNNSSKGSATDELNARNSSNNVTEEQICQSDEILSFVTNRGGEVEDANFGGSTNGNDDEEDSFLRRILREDSTDEEKERRQIIFDDENSISGSKKSKI